MENKTIISILEKLLDEIGQHELIPYKGHVDDDYIEYVKDVIERLKKVTIKDILQELVDIIECYATNDNITDERYNKEKESLICQAEQRIIENKRRHR